MKAALARMQLAGAINTTQLSLQMQRPDRRFEGFDITLLEQTLGNRLENLLGDERPVEWALRFDCRRLRCGHTRSAEQCPAPITSRQWADHAFDTRDQTKALTGKAEAARHGDDPRGYELAAYTPSDRTVKGKVIHVICG